MQNDEIKEILTNCEKAINEASGYNDTTDKILDYITNLQQENEYLKKNNPEQNIEHFRIIKENKRKINNLREENEDNLKCIKSLKEQLESVINENQRLLKQWFEDNDKTVKLVSEKECYKSNYNDYKSRCEKAIELLESVYMLDNVTITNNACEKIDNAINILQNESDSQ